MSFTLNFHTPVSADGLKTTLHSHPPTHSTTSDTMTLNIEQPLVSGHLTRWKTGQHACNMLHVVSQPLSFCVFVTPTGVKCEWCEWNVKQ